jgi:L-threonylcarbamoyladenylate synthase
MQDEVQKTVQILKNGGVILYPTDTVWGIGCDATQKFAVEKIYQIKQRVESKSLILLVDTIERLRNYVEFVPEFVLELLEKTTNPTTVIYPKARNLPANLLASDSSIAIRVVKHEFCKQIIKLLNAPLVSSSANISGEPTPTTFSEISYHLKTEVDYVVEYEQEEVQEKNASTIIKLIDNSNYQVIRP